MNIGLNEKFSAMPAWLVRHRKWVLSAYVVFLVVSFAGAGKVWRDDSIESWFDSDSAIIKTKHQFEEYFGSNEDVYLVYEAKDGDIFSERSLEALLKLHNALASYPLVIQQNPDTPLSHIRGVRSLINEQVTRVDGDDLYMNAFIGNRLPAGEQARRELKQKALANRDFILKFVSRDGRYGGISIKTDFGMAQDTPETAAGDAAVLSFSLDESAPAAVEEEESRKIDYLEYAAFMDAVKQQAESAGAGEALQLYYTGLPEMIAFQVKVIAPELGVIYLALFVMIIAMLLFVFRHFAAVVWSLTIIITTLIGTFGIIGWSGRPMTSLSDAMVLLIILISILDAVHILAAYRYYRLHGDDHPTALAHAFGKSGTACFLTTLTTVVGFVSLWAVRSSVPVADFGLFSAVGLSLALIVTMTLLPVGLSFWTVRVKAAGAETAEVRPKQFVFSLMEGVFRFVSGRPGAVLVCYLGCVAAVGVGALRLEVDTNTLETLDESTYLRKAFEVADRHMGGTQNIDIMVDTGAIDGVYNGEVLKTIDNLQQKIVEAYPDLVVTDVSIVNVLKQINRQLHQDDPAFYSLPESNEEISQLLFLFNNVAPDERAKLVSENFDAARIAFSVRNGGSSRYISLVNDVERWGVDAFNKFGDRHPDLSVQTTGGLVMFMTLFNEVTRSQIESFLMTFAVIAFVMLWIFASIPLGLVGLAANLVPAVVTFGVMGWLGVPLDSTTMIIAPIILGLSVDDTIHFINTYKIISRRVDSVAEAIRLSLREIGSALCFTSLILAAGLLTMLYSSNQSFQHFGYLSALAIGVGLLAELLMVPAGLLLLDKRRQPVPVTDATINSRLVEDN